MKIQLEKLFNSEGARKEFCIIDTTIKQSDGAHWENTNPLELCINIECPQGYGVRVDLDRKESQEILKAYGVESPIELCGKPIRAYYLNKDLLGVHP